MEPKFFNTNGSLTAYSFACGYVEREENETHYKEIFMEHSHYHVKSGLMSHKWEVWETFDTLTEARRFYNKLRRRNNYKISKGAISQPL